MMVAQDGGLMSMKSPPPVPEDRLEGDAGLDHGAASAAQDQQTAVLSARIEALQEQNQRLAHEVLRLRRDRDYYRHLRESQPIPEQAERMRSVHLRNALTAEVHHRIRNNLQVVIGLLQRESVRRPDAADAIRSVISQVKTVALAHGLHGRADHHLISLQELLTAIVANVTMLTGCVVEASLEPDDTQPLLVREGEAVALALILNELLINAVKHLSAPAVPCPPKVSLARGGDGALVTIVNQGRLPVGFDFLTGRGSGSGLGLVHALFSTPGTEVRFSQIEDTVEVRLIVAPPVLIVEHVGGM